jgi:carbonic anhydrase/acetyltransferase-like protein (isoleucine patch superfamily)
MREVQNVYLSDTARVMGEVTLGQGVNLWYGAVVRGDVATISIGKGTNLQENVTVHCDGGTDNHIGENVSLGHGAIAHGKSVGDGSLIGMGAVLLGGSVVGKGCLIAARALVKENMVVPDGMVVMGIPGKIVRPVSDKEKEFLRWLAPHYVKLARKHHEHPDDPICQPWPDETIAIRT